MEGVTEKRRIEVEPLGRETLQDRVYNQIAGLILDGGIVPGQLVTIQGLADAFGVSAMPVREALKRLTAANALNVVSGRSIGIPRLSLDRLVDLRNVRSEVEGTAAAWAARAIDPAGLALLEDQLDRMDRSIPGGEHPRLSPRQPRLPLHDLPRGWLADMVSLIEILWLQISPYFNLLRESGNYVSANIHHRAMIDALAGRDEAAARAAVVADITGSFKVLEKIVV